MKMIVRLLAATLAMVIVKCQTTSSATSSVEAMITDYPTETTTSFASAQSDCPTVTLTSNVCQTCAIPDCVQIRPVTQPCGCPSAIPTVFVDYPCESGCGGVGCAADYVFFTENCTVPTSSLASDSSTTTLTASSAPWMGAVVNGTNTTTSRTTIFGTSTAFVSASPSIAAARRMRPFWAVWLNI